MPAIHPSVALGAPTGMRSKRFAVGGDEYLLISYELSDPRRIGMLTPAERDVALGLVRGWSLLRIATARRTSRRTVANQAQAIYRKLAVASRLELAALLRGPRDEAMPDVWRSLVRGEWSLVETFDGDGHRFMVARRNPDAAPQAPLFSEREQRVLGLRARAHGIKQIAYELGLSQATVSRIVLGGLRKLGLPTLLELTRFDTQA